MAIGVSCLWSEVCDVAVERSGVQPGAALTQHHGRRQQHALVVLVVVVNGCPHAEPAQQQQHHASPQSQNPFSEFIKFSAETPQAPGKQVTKIEIFFNFLKVRAVLVSDCYHGSAEQGRAQAVIDR